MLHKLGMTFCAVSLGPTTSAPLCLAFRRSYLFIGAFRCLATCVMDAAIVFLFPFVQEEIFAFSLTGIFEIIEVATVGPVTCVFGGFLLS